MKTIRALANTFAILSAIYSGLILVKNRMPWGILIWPLRLVAGALSPFVALSGLVSALLGLISGSPLAALAGLFAAVTSARYVWKSVKFDDGFAGAFGADWWERIPDERKSRMLHGHWTWLMPAPPQVAHERDVPFATIPGTSRQLLCDLWLPSMCVEPSGLAFIYLHGSAWYLGDKDMGTRLLFRQLAAQGHLIMDVAYRMSPETDMFGMVGDAKRAVAWLKEHGAQYGVDPDRIVIGGASAGSHITMLAAFSGDHPELTPLDLQGLELGVCGVVAIYGPSDLTANYYHTAQHITTRELERELTVSKPGLVRQLLQSLMGERYTHMGLHKPTQTSAFLYLLGGHPEELPEKYELFSPVHHVHPGCPPTLLIHGGEDLLVPVEGTLALEKKLRAAGVPVVSLILPQTDHAFDLVLPRWSPPAQAALYEIERFLAIMALPDNPSQ
ncbi:MAG: alpha/beta hydrolase [Anaerolineae bacterium]